MWMLEELATGEEERKEEMEREVKRREEEKVGGERGFHFVSIWQS
jgi:hypothetical protein